MPVQCGMFRLRSKFETAAAGGNEEAGRPEGSGFKLHTHDFILALNISGNLKCCTTGYIEINKFDESSPEKRGSSYPSDSDVNDAVIIQIHDAVNRLAEELHALSVSSSSNALNTDIYRSYITRLIPVGAYECRAATLEEVRTPVIYCLICK